MQKVLCVCVRDEKSWNIEPNETKSQYLIYSYLWCSTWEYFNSLYIKCITLQNLMFSYMRSQLLYIYEFWSTCWPVKRLQLRLEIEFIYTYLIIRLLRNYTIKCFKMFRYIIKSKITFNIDTNTSALYF